MYSDEQKYYPDAYIKGPGAEKYYRCAYLNGTDIDFSKAIMADYIRNYKVYRCPEFEIMNNVTSMVPSMSSTCSYGINAEYVGGTPDPNPAPTENDILNSSPARIVEIKKPAKTLIFMDTAKGETSAQLAETYYFWARYYYAPAVTAEHESASHFRHLRFANGIFCDGHAEDNLIPDAIDKPELKVGWPSQDKCERD